MERSRYKIISPTPFYLCLFTYRLPFTAISWLYGVQTPCLSLQEYQQLSADWEKQRVQHQNQQTALEAQNKSLTDELTHVKVKAD